MSSPTRGPALTGKPLQFVPLSSDLELPFYTALFARKLDHDRLDDSARSIIGQYEARVCRPEDSCKVQLLGSALTNQHSGALGTGRSEGLLRNTNTLEAFQTIDRAEILQAAGRQIWDAIQDGTIYSIPSLLASFNMISYAELKKYSFSYWFAFPALHSSWVHAAEPIGFTPSESTALVDSIGTWQYRVKDARQHGFFLAKKVPRTADDEVYEDEDEDAPRLPYRWAVDSLGEFHKGFFEGVSADDIFVGFLDSSTYPQNPGWQLRNLLVLVQQRYKMNKVNILCLRDTHRNRDAARSFVLPLEWAPGEVPATAMPKVTGWEKNGTSFKFKRVNLAAYMDPARLADQSVDLNLKLMKWRLAPSLDLDAISSTKCLLLGAGTLGSYVSRNLLGWGVRHVTFIDYGKVSFSNPVRQPLFNFNDCLEGGAPKAARAAAALKEIFPGVTSEGHSFAVPMLGHAVANWEDTQADFEKLRDLFEAHDAIFLLMDTRESRWLPTVMGKAMGKIVLTAALGFDNFVIMRHGAEADSESEEDKPLGCYFCNDVVTPADSMKDQTLDQQCTVTRPGAAPIASALLVELLSSIVQHPLKNKAPAPQFTAGQTPARDPVDHPLGLVPHQIRGYLSTFQHMPLRGEAFSSCSACSPRILAAYREDPWGFVKQALADRDFVTALSGLQEVQRAAEAAAKDMDWDDSGDGDSGDGEGELL